MCKSTDLCYCLNTILCQNHPQGIMTGWLKGKQKRTLDEKKEEWEEKNTRHRINVSEQQLSFLINDRIWVNLGSQPEYFSIPDITHTYIPSICNISWQWSLFGWYLLMQMMVTVKRMNQTK